MLYNRLLEERILEYRTKGKGLSYYDQVNTLYERKQYIPALKQVHSQVLQDVARRLDKAFQAFFRRVKQGKTPGFPKFKAQQRYNSFTYPQSGYAITGNKIYLSMIGNVKIKLHRQPQGKMKTCTILVNGGKYYACISCEVEHQPLPLSDKNIGVDLNSMRLAHHQEPEISKHLLRNQNRLNEIRVSLSRKKPESNRRKKAVLYRAQIYEKMANQRKDYAHKFSRQLVNRYSHISFNDHDEQNSNECIQKPYVSWLQLIQFTKYKAESAGRVVVCTESNCSKND
ncbi:putative transposase [compost metagenome]